MGTRISTGILLVAGLVLIVLRPGGWLVLGLLITIAGVVRIWELRRGKLRHVPWPLTFIALFMPGPAGPVYLEELGYSANEVRGRERGRHVWHAVVASPRTLVTVWHSWLRAKLVGLTVRAVSRRVHEVQLMVQADPRRHRVARRRLRRYCRLILLATGRWQYHEYAVPAHALLLSCRQPVEKGGGAELDARIQQEMEKLACALTSRRPDRA